MLLCSGSALDLGCLLGLCVFTNFPSIPSAIIMPSTPPTSPQRHQEAARQAERSNRLMASPEQRRTPAGPSTSVALPPPIVQASSEQHTSGNLAQHLVAGIQNLIPIPPVPRRGRPVSSTLAPPPVSLILY